MGFESDDARSPGVWTALDLAGTVLVVVVVVSWQKVALLEWRLARDSSTSPTMGRRVFHSGHVNIVKYCHFAREG